MFGRKVRSFRRAHSGLLSPLIALLLLAAPTVRTLQSVCDLCPPTCPMHNAAKAKHSKPSCHNQGSMRMHHAEGHGMKRQTAHGVVLTRPPCGHNGAVPGVAMGPMILADARSTVLHLPVEDFQSREQLLRIRFSDPPSLPPPIVVS